MDIMGMTQTEGEEVENYMDSVIVQGNAFDCMREHDQLPPAIVNGIRPNLQEAILHMREEFGKYVKIREPPFVSSTKLMTSTSFQIYIYMGGVTWNDSL